MVERVVGAKALPTVVSAEIVARTDGVPLLVSSDIQFCEYWVSLSPKYVGAPPEKGARGREVETKAIVLVAAEKSGRGVGRIRLRRVKDVSRDSPAGNQW